MQWREQGWSDPYVIITTMTERCAACGAAPEMKTVTITDFDGTETQQVPWRCSNPGCTNRDPANHDFDWLVPA